MLGGLHFSVKCSQEPPHMVTCYAVTGTLEAAWLQSRKCLRYPGDLWDPRRLGQRLRCLVTPRKLPAGEIPLTLCDPMDRSLPGSSVHGIFRQEYWSGLPFPSPGDLPDPVIEPGSPALWADTLPSEPPGKSKEWTSAQFTPFYSLSSDMGLGARGYNCQGPAQQ